MNKLDALWEYQKAELGLEAAENRVKTTPSRQKLNRLHAFLTEQQNSLSSIQRNIDSRKTLVDKLSSEVEELSRKYELELSEFNAMMNDEGVTAEEMTESRKALESIRARTDSVRKELFDTIAWIEKAMVDSRDTYAKAAKAKKEYDTVRKECEDEMQSAQPEIDAARRVMETAAKGVDAALLAKYKTIKGHHAVPMARVENNQCGGCNMSLPTTTVKRVVAGTGIVECENCGRILYS